MSKTWREAAAQDKTPQIMHDALKEEMDGPIGKRVREIAALSIGNLHMFSKEEIIVLLNRTLNYAWGGGRNFAESDEETKKIFEQLLKEDQEAMSRTLISISHAALTQARSEALGYDWYIWRTAKDGTRVRPSHRIMEDVMCRWSDPPAPEELAHEKRTYGHYHPGDIFNCRCFAESIIVATQVIWPHKVYADGHIQTMQKRAFESIYGKVGD